MVLAADFKRRSDICVEVFQKLLYTVARRNLHVQIQGNNMLLNNRWGNLTGLLPACLDHGFPGDIWSAPVGNQDPALDGLWV